VGDGVAVLSAAAAPVFIERRYFDSVGDLVPSAGNPLALQSGFAESGTNQPLTLSGTTLRDGVLSLSTDGRYASLLGYGAAVGYANVATSRSAAVNRIVARIDANNNVDTSTRLPASFDGNNARSAISADGSGFWVAGAEGPADAGAGTGGVQYVPFGGAGGTPVLALPKSVRAALLFGGQLYGSSGDSPFSAVFTVGTGEPSSGAQIATLLSGMPNTGQSPLSFVFFDLKPAVPGLDTLYVADDRAPNAATATLGGGIQKWTLAIPAGGGTATWTLAATFNHDPAAAAVAIRQITGRVLSGNSVVLIGSSAEATTRLLRYVDDGTSANPTPTVLSTSGVNQSYRGVSLAP
jgi:hypothetical protein